MINLKKESGRMVQWPLVSSVIGFSKRIVLPGFDGMPLYDVMVFFIQGLWKGALTSRAAAISFSFFLAIFPMLVFLFTIIPMVPISDFQDSLMDMIRELIPGSAFSSVEETIRDIIT